MEWWTLSPATPSSRGRLCDSSIEAGPFMVASTGPYDPGGYSRGRGPDHQSEGQEVCPADDEGAHGWDLGHQGSPRQFRSTWIDPQPAQPGDERRRRGLA